MKFNKKTFVNRLWILCTNKKEIFETLEFLLKYNCLLSRFNQRSYENIYQDKILLYYFEKANMNGDLHIGTHYESFINRLLSKNVKYCARLIVKRFNLDCERYKEKLCEFYPCICRYIYEDKK